MRHDAHILLPPEVAAALPPLYSQETNPDPLLVVKYFTPDAGWTWYAYEYDPAERLFFGLVQGFEEELGYFSLNELEAVRGPMGLRIERDLYWTPTPLSKVRKERG